MEILVTNILTEIEFWNNISEKKYIPCGKNEHDIIIEAENDIIDFLTSRNIVVVEYNSMLLSKSKQRELAYSTESIINWDNEQFTCDRFRIERLSPYFFSNNSRYNEALIAWSNARADIQAKYPD